MNAQPLLGRLSVVSHPYPVQALFEQAARLVQEAGVFDAVHTTQQSLRCQAKHVASDTSYRMDTDPNQDGVVWVGLYSPDRWLSESIEADLMHQGDKIEELLEEELVDQGLELQLPIEHFRDDQKQYVFRSPVSLNSGGALKDNDVARYITRVLLAYEATFRQLGDMKPPDESTV